MGRMMALCAGLGFLGCTPLMAYGTERAYVTTSHVLLVLLAAFLIGFVTWAVRRLGARTFAFLFCFCVFSVALDVLTEDLGAWAPWVRASIKWPVVYLVLWIEQRRVRNAVPTRAEVSA